MFVFKLMSFLLGYVTMLVKGQSQEKFINMAASRGIYIWDIVRLDEDNLLIKVRISAVHPLRHIARKTGCRFEIRDRAGLPFVMARMKRRKAMVAGAVLFLAALYILSSFVWFVEVKGNKNVTTQEVMEAARKAGLFRGVSKWSFKAPEVENTIRDELPRVSWTGVYVDGTRVTIEIAEKILPEAETKQRGPLHIVARKAGLVEEVLVLTGNPAVREGDTVVEGQILISGEVPPPEQETLPQDAQDGLEPEMVPGPTYVQAKGIVRARIWYDGYGEASLVEEGRHATGASITRLCMKIGAKEIILKGPREIPYELFETETSVKRPPQWRNIKLPVELITEKYREVENYREKRSPEEARRLAEEKAMAELDKELPREARVLQRRVQEVEVGRAEELVRIKVFLETLEDIGEEKVFAP